MPGIWQIRRLRMASREEIDRAKQYILQQRNTQQQVGPSRGEIDAAKQYILSQRQAEPESSFWGEYAKTNKELNKKLARGIVGLPDLVSGGAASRKLQELGINLAPE